MKISWIEPGVLAASSVPFDVRDVRALHTQGIRAILSLTEHPLTIFRSITPALFVELDIAYCHAPVRDHHAPELSQARRIVAFLQAMKTEGRPAFVHCHAGVGRTGTALHLYFLSEGLTLEEARARVRARRPQCILLSEAQEAFLSNVSVTQPLLWVDASNADLYS
ncbi:MAG: dual specificity protein phosphatase family protein [Ardenticatenales bacterium]|nr:dual specificity protein phosphatase family protein [Ardenticatenales bacterium]